MVPAKFRLAEEPPVLPFRYWPALIPAFLAAPASASAGLPLPEPNSLFLLGVGVVGVIVGRRLSSKDPQD